MAREHARTFAMVPGVSLAGICSRTRTRAEALAADHSIPCVAETIDELYEKSRARLIVVAVSEDTAREVAEICCGYPWVVLLEKPPGLNLGEARQIRHQASTQGSTVLVALNRRFYSGTQAVLEGLAGETGPRHIHVKDQQSLDDAAALGKPVRVLEHWMYVNSIHLIDYLRVFGRGPITAVSPVFSWSASAPSVVVAKLEFESGDTGIYEAIWRGPGPWAASVTTARRHWELRPLEQLHVQRVGERTWEVIAPSVWDRAFKPGLRAQAEHAVAAALGKPSDSVTLDDALRTMQLVASIYGLA